MADSWQPFLGIWQTPRWVHGNQPRTEGQGPLREEGILTFHSEEDPERNQGHRGRNTAFEKSVVGVWAGKHAGARCATQGTERWRVSGLVKCSAVAILKCLKIFFNFFFFTFSIVVLFSAIIATWISRNYTYIPSLLSLAPLPPPHASRSSQSARLSSLCYTETSHQLSILRMIMYICWCYVLHSSHFLPSQLRPQIHSLHLCVHSFPANRSLNTIFLHSMYIRPSILVFHWALQYYIAGPRWSCGQVF